MTVTVYSKPACVACTATYRALDNKGLSYAKIDVTEDDSALDYTRSLGYMAAPVIVVKDEEGNVVDHWSQFRGDKIAELV
jgi:glutaredoxin-like protein NrdH